MMFEKLYVKLAESVTKTFYGPVATGIVEKIRRDGNIFCMLDVGAGPGDLVLEVSKRLPHLLIGAVDISKKSIEIASHRARRQGVHSYFQITFDVMDARFLKYASNSWDFVVSSGVLHAMKNPEEAIKEWVRVLRPGHELWIYDPTPLILKEELSDKKLLKKKLPKWKDRVSFSLARKFCGDIPPRVMPIEDVAHMLVKAVGDSLFKVEKKENYLKIEIKKM